MALQEDPQGPDDQTQWVLAFPEVRLQVGSFHNKTLTNLQYSINTLGRSQYQ